MSGERRAVAPGKPPRIASLALRGLLHYRGEHLLVGAATAVAVVVLVGALVVGDAVRGSLRAAFTERLGAADFAVLPGASFSDDPETGLPARLASDPAFAAVFAEPVPILRLRGTASVAGGAPVPVTVFGVDGRYFAFHGLDGEIAAGGVRVSSGLRMGDAAVAPGDSLLVRVGDDPAIATASLFGEKDDFATSLRRTVEGWPGEDAAGPGRGDFALFPQQGAVNAVFLPLDELRRALGGRDAARRPEANALLVKRLAPAGEDADAAPDVLAEALRSAAVLDDYGLEFRAAGEGAAALVLESRSLVLSDEVVGAAAAAGEASGATTHPVLTWLASSLRANSRETPYSLVSGLPEGLLPPGAAGEAEPIAPGNWLADDLALGAGDAVEVEFLTWEVDGSFGSQTASFRVGETGPGAALAADPTLSPEYPGVSDSDRMSDWDPPFPVDLSRIRDRDEDYWYDYRTLPKAFVPLEAVRREVDTRLGGATSVRFTAAGEAQVDRAAIEPALLEALDPEAFGLTPIPVRAQGLEASEGATDFGQYFLYFSGFLLASAFVLIVLLFRLGIERRFREIGLLLACGWPRRRVSSLLLFEVGVVAFVGALVGAALGLAYAAGMIRLLGGVWGGAVAGTLAGGGAEAGPPLTLFVSWKSVGAGALGGLEMACLSAWWTVRRLVRRSSRALLAGDLTTEPLVPPGPEARVHARGGFPAAAVASAVGAVVLVGLTAAGVVPETGGFFGAGGLLLTAALLYAWARLRSAANSAVSLAGRGLRGLAFRASSFRPGRSLAAMALIAFAAFMLVAVESFRKRSAPGELPAGAGGFLAVTETVFGSPWDPTDPEGREALNLPMSSDGLRIRPLRIAGADDASCLNLYRPARPRLVGIPRALAEENRFPFGAHLGETAEERENPWRLLWRERGPDDPIPVIGDQNSMTYVLKWPVGEGRSYPVGEGGRELRLVLVGTLWDSLFQGELLMAEDDLLARLPAEDGYRMFLVEREGEAPGSEATLTEAEVAAAGLLADPLSDYGAVSTPTRERIAAFHRVENTYLSTFQALGGLGLLLGTLGLGAVLLRNAAERRREWALLAAAGYRRSDFSALGFWENALLLSAGLAAGAGSAVVAVLPVLGLGNPGANPGGSLWLIGALLLGVLAFGLVAGALAARSAASRPLLASLRSG